MIQQPSINRFPGLALVAIAIGLGGLAAKAFEGGHDLAASFETAIGGSGAARAAGTRNVANAPPIVGNEAFWLDGRRPSEVSRASFANATHRLAPGDRFELQGKAGKRVLEVVDVRALDGAFSEPVAHTDKADAKPSLLVSLRVVGSDGDLVRMIVDAESPFAGLAPLAQAAQRAL